jgi:ABC-2 type transport system permease protein
MIPFLKKEILEQLRSGKLMILSILFVLFGIMNPATAKLTPWLLEMMADSMAQGGMTITAADPTALDSWMQFYKNIPMALIAFILMESNIFTREYQSGTMLLSLTKGLSRYKVVIAKSLVLILLWTLGYWLCFGITYGYNAYFWDNSIAKNLITSVVYWWVFGLWVIGLVILFSTLSNENTGVLVGTGGIVLVSSLLSFFPKLSNYLPTSLSDGNSLIYGLVDTDKYTTAFVIAAVTGLTCIALSIPIFNKKQL